MLGPSALLRDVQISVQLHPGHAPEAGHTQVDGKDLLAEPESRFRRDTAGSHAEMLAADDTRADPQWAQCVPPGQRRASNHAFAAASSENMLASSMKLMPCRCDLPGPARQVVTNLYELLYPDLKSKILASHVYNPTKLHQLTILQKQKIIELRYRQPMI